MRSVLVAIGLVAVASFASVTTVDAQQVRLPGTWSLSGAVWQQGPAGGDGLAVHIDTNQGPPYNQAFGGLSVILPSGTQIEDVGPLAFDYYFVTGNCGGGSPRFQLRVDLNDDGVGDKNVFVYPGPAPNYNNCPVGSWQHDNTIQDGGNRWDSSQVGGTFYGTKALANAAAGPGHQVLSVVMVWDSEWLTGPGDMYWDNVTVNTYVLDEPQAMACVHLLKKDLVRVCPNVEIVA